jgi:excisionase family DNA binding protein
MEDIRLSISEASRIFGISQQTVRRAIKSQQLKYIVVRSRYRLSFLSLLKWSQSGTATKNKLANRGIGQFVEGWKITNKLYSPHPDKVKAALSPIPTPQKNSP